MNSIAKPIRNFEEWTLDYYSRGYIEVIGDEENGFDLVIPDEVLDSAFRWLASRYDPKDGAQCIDFVIDEILDEATDKYSARLLTSILTEHDPVAVAESARELRRYYARRKIEYFKSDLVEREKPAPDASQARKDRIESGLCVVPYKYPRLG